MKCEFKEVTDQIPTSYEHPWCYIDSVGDEDEILERHVVPINDSDGHQTGLTCHCEPEIQYKDPETGEDYGGVPIVVHNAFDGRHLVEQAEKILSEI